MKCDGAVEEINVPFVDENVALVRLLLLFALDGDKQKTFYKPYSKEIRPAISRSILVLIKVG